MRWFDDAYAGSMTHPRNPWWGCTGMENTFIAQAYDAADPGVRYQGDDQHTWSELDSPYQAGFDRPFPGRQGYSGAGLQAFTQQYMGGLHPRAKQTIGRRLALAAANVAYGQADVPFTGQVLKSEKEPPFLPKI